MTGSADPQSTGTTEPPADTTEPATDATEPASEQHQLGSVPFPNNHDDAARPSFLLYALLFLIMFVVGAGAIAWLCTIIDLQLFMLLAPSIELYSLITSELTAWRKLDPTSPCPQLWKDWLEDELWWF